MPCPACGAAPWTGLCPACNAINNAVQAEQTAHLSALPEWATGTCSDHPQQPSLLCEACIRPGWRYYRGAFRPPGWGNRGRGR
jgi:hypothetical protein